jgi:multiple sugar transport system permease protein
MARNGRSTLRTMLGEARRHIVGITVSLLFLAPLAWSVLVSFKPTAEARQPPLPPWPVDGFSTQNYENLAKFGAGISTYALMYNWARSASHAMHIQYQTNT